MLKFIRDRHQVAVDPVSLTLEPLLKIWVADDTPNKEIASRILTYIHLTSQIDKEAPYHNAAPDEVSKLVKKELWGNYEHHISDELPEDEEITDEFIEEAVLHYQGAYETVEEAAVRSYDKKIYEIRAVIDKTKVEIKESVSRGSIVFSSNFPLINKMMQDVIKIVKARDELKALVLKQSTRESIKGDKKLSFNDKRRRELRKTTEGPSISSPIEEEPIGL